MQEKKLDNIHYKEFAPENSKDTIVILHGWGGSSESWIQVGEILENNGYRVIIPDLPGFGETPLDKVYSLDDYANTVINFIQKLNLNNIILWGHSNGGAISILIANKNIIKIKQLVLIGAAGIRNDEKRNKKRNLVGNISKPLKTLSKYEWFKKPRKLIYKAIGGQDYINSEEVPYMKETYLNVISTDISDEIKKITEDTLLIRGDKDIYTPLSDGEYMHKNIKTNNFIVLDGEKHGIHIQNPLRLVNTFLKNLSI